MADQKQADLEQRLARLNEILGTTCTIREDPTESEVEEEKEKKREATEKMKQSATDTPAPAEPGDTLPPPAQPTMPRDVVSLKRGDAGHKGMVYTAWSTMLAYPDQFIGKTNRPKVKPFFVKILQLIDWDFFYFYDPENQSAAAHLLVPTSQAESYLSQINLVLNTALRIPSGPHRKLFYIRFPSDNMPHPRYLHAHRIPSAKPGELLPLDSTTDIAATIDLITDRDLWPAALAADAQLFDVMGDEDRDFWITAKARLDTVIDKSKKEAEERRRKRAAHSKQCLEKTLSLLDEKDVVLISIDFEALEGPPHPISEIGICIFDTRQLVGGTDAGRNATSWWPLIQAHHIRVKEYAGLRNYRHVKGCPKNFDFGRSVIVPKSGIANDVIRILRPFTSAGRHVALVGHDLSQDTRYLAKIGVKLEGPVEELDTQKVHKAWKRADMQRSLKKVLEDLEINYRYLHNAGNDAMYTLRALLAMAVRVKEEALADEPDESGSI